MEPLRCHLLIGPPASGKSTTAAASSLVMTCKSEAYAAIRQGQVPFFLDQIRLGTSGAGPGADAQPERGQPSPSG